MKIIRMKDAVIYRKEFIKIRDDVTYRRCNVQLHRRGVKTRDIVQGNNIKTKNQRVCKADDFIVAEMDAKFGGYGMVPKELEGAVVSSHYYLYELKKNILLPRFLEIIIDSGVLQEQIKAVGSTNYSRVSAKEVLEYQIPCPSLDRQQKIIDFYYECKNKNISLEEELKSQKILLKKLRQQILQDAIEGNLTAAWRKENHDVEPSSKLLQKLITKKEQLIKNKKIRAPKPLSLVTENEKLFALPGNWTWCRLGNLYEIARGSSPRPKGDPRFWSKSRTSYHWITIADFTPFGRNNTLFDTKAFLTAEGTKHSRKVKSTDLLVACSGVGSVGRSIKLGIEGYIYDGLLAVRDIEDETIREYLSIFLKFKEAQIYSIATGANWLNINTDLLSNYVLALPPKEEMKEIIKKFEWFNSACDELETQIAQNKFYADQLMQAVLKDVFTRVEERSPEPNNIVKLNPLENKQEDYYKRILLAAEIIDQLHKEPTMGHLKLQKIIFLCQKTQNMKLPSNFLKQAAGPYDPQMARSLDKQLKDKQWYGYNGSATLKYQPLNKAGSHKNDFQKYFQNDRDSIKRLIDLFKTKKSNEIEAVATLYACWEEILDSGQSFSKPILIERFFAWSEEKRKFSERQVNQVIVWMEKHNIIPT